MVVDGPIDGDLFVAYVRQHLCPTLKAGDIVIMDNLASHKVRGVEAAIRQAQATLVYLPPYSPDFNPIEQVFAKVKLLLRKAKKRTVSDLWKQLGQIVGLFDPQECCAYIQHCGYNFKSMDIN